MTPDFYRTSLIVLVVVGAGAGIIFGWNMLASVVVGGLLSMLNAKWLAHIIDSALGRASTPKATSLALQFVLRLVLIFGVLFAIILTSFLSLLGVVAGLSICVVSAGIEEFRAVALKGR